MTIQDQQQVRRVRKKRVVVFGITFFLLLGIAVFWIANVRTGLSDVLGIVFTLLGTMLSLLQWPVQEQCASQSRSGLSPWKEQCQLQVSVQRDGMTPETDRHRGALVVYTHKDVCGSTINVSFGFDRSCLRVDVASSVVGRKRDGQVIFVAVFSLLEAGNYTVYDDAQKLVTRVSIAAGKVEEVDWR